MILWNRKENSSQQRVHPYLNPNPRRPSPPPPPKQTVSSSSSSYYKYNYPHSLSVSLLLLYHQVSAPTQIFFLYVLPSLYVVDLSGMDPSLASTTDRMVTYLYLGFFVVAVSLKIDSVVWERGKLWLLVRGIWDCCFFV